jgi:SAM-dependent methyltransferase
MPDLFGSSSMGAGYANSRPPVHPRVIERVLAQLGSAQKFPCVLDVGCGAGLSTRPLIQAADLCIAFDPAEAMAQWGATVAPGAIFLVARAEAMPFRSGSVDLMTAAGSLNYTDLDLFFPEALRVLKTTGTLVVYDFSQGRSLRDCDDLDMWFDQFLVRYPAPPDPINHLDPERLGRIAGGMHLSAHEHFEIGLPVSPQFYVDYIMTETNISHAVARGAKEADIRAWCETSLVSVFAGQEREVLFRGYIAYLQVDRLRYP